MVVQIPWAWPWTEFLTGSRLRSGLWVRRNIRCVEDVNSSVVGRRGINRVVVNKIIRGVRNNMTGGGDIEIGVLLYLL